MKKISLLFATLLLSVASFSVSAQSKKAQEWFNGKEWLQGAQFIPAPSVDVEQFAAHYKAHPNRWNAIFKFLASNDLATLPLGAKKLNEKVKMNVQEYQTRPTKGKKILFERHSKYIDVQCVVSGAELQGTRKVEFGKEVKPYIAAKDIAMYDSEYVPFYLIGSGDFTIFFPDDIHTSNYGFGERSKVKKIVFKVEY